jgi:hypothetical protein
VQQRREQDGRRGLELECAACRPCGAGGAVEDRVLDRRVAIRIRFGAPVVPLVRISSETPSSGVMVQPCQRHTADRTSSSAGPSGT